MIYVASPYSHKSEFMRKARFKAAENFVNLFSSRHGMIVYSPIVYCHEMSMKFNWPFEVGYYAQFNHDMLRYANLVAVLCIQGWEESIGVKTEMNIAKILGIPTQLFNSDATEYVHADNQHSRSSPVIDPNAS